MHKQRVPDLMRGATGAGAGSVEGAAGCASEIGSGDGSGVEPVPTGFKRMDMTKICEACPILKYVCGA